MLKRIDGFLKPNFKAADAIVVGQASSLSGFCGKPFGHSHKLQEKTFRWPSDKRDRQDACPTTYFTSVWQNFSMRAKPFSMFAKLVA